MLFYLLACQISSPQVQDNIIYSLLKKVLCFSNLSRAGVIWTKCRQCVCTYKDNDFDKSEEWTLNILLPSSTTSPLRWCHLEEYILPSKTCFKKCSSFLLLYRQSNLKCKYYLQISMPNTELLRMLLYVIFVNLCNRMDSVDSVSLYF